MSRCAAHLEIPSITCPECYRLERQESDSKGATCKTGKCGLHCASYSDIDWDKPGCQWCDMLEENERFTHLINKQEKELAELRCTGQHMTCGQCEQLRQTQKRKDEGCDGDCSQPNCEAKRVDPAKKCVNCNGEPGQGLGGLCLACWGGFTSSKQTYTAEEQLEMKGFMEGRHGQEEWDSFYAFWQMSRRMRTLSRIAGAIWSCLPFSRSR